MAVASTERAVAVRNEDAALKALDAEIERRRAVLEDSAASLIDPRRLKGVVLSVFTRRPELWECDPVSVARAVVEAAQVGLEPTGAIGGAHLVPYRNGKTGKTEAQLIIDYRGLVALARRSSDVRRVEARVVRQKDEFDYAYGLEPVLRHVPSLEDDPGPLMFVYAVAIFRDGERQFEVMSAAQIEVIRKRSKAGERGPWVSDYFEMAKKTVLRRLSKLLPLTVEARQVLEFEDEQERDDTPAVRVTKAAQLRSTLRDRVTQRFATADTTEPPTDASEDEAAVDVPAEPAAAGAQAPASCGAANPYSDEGAACGREAGHVGPHGQGRETWM